MTNGKQFAKGRRIGRRWSQILLWVVIGSLLAIVIRQRLGAVRQRELLTRTMEVARKQNELIEQQGRAIQEFELRCGDRASPVTDSQSQK
jgi:hypothetical protein